MMIIKLPTYLSGQSSKLKEKNMCETLKILNVNSNRNDLIFLPVLKYSNNFKISLDDMQSKCNIR